MILHQSIEFDKNRHGPRCGPMPVFVLYEIELQFQPVVLTELFLDRVAAAERA